MMNGSVLVVEYIVDNVHKPDIVQDNVQDIVQDTLYEYEPTFDYDTQEEIQMCLNCQKPDCDNCLKTINGV